MIFPAPPDGRCRVRRRAGALPGPVLSPTRPGFSRPTIRQPLAVLFASGFDTFQVDTVVAAGNVTSHRLGFIAQGTRPTSVKIHGVFTPWTIADGCPILLFTNVLASSN